METVKATVAKHDEKYFIMIDIGEEEISIPISEDKANEVKGAFNKLITRIKHGEFKIELGEVGQDLFSQVAVEYITQLNREIQEVRGEMKGYGLIED
jgi:hypothetical protein